VTKPFQCSDLDLLDSIIQTEIQTPIQDIRVILNIYIG